MPQTPHIEKHFTASKTVRDIVIGMSDGLFVQIAEGLGIRSILHTDYESAVRNWLRLDCIMAKEASMKPANPSILTINGGSSSIKFALFEAGDPLRTDSGGRD